MRSRMLGLSFLSALFAMPAMAAAPMSLTSTMPANKSERRRASIFVDEYVDRNPGYRARGKQAKPRKRSNRLRISRRVRRAHRRSRAA